MKSDRHLADDGHFLSVKGKASLAVKQTSPAFEDSAGQRGW